MSLILAIALAACTAASKAGTVFTKDDLARLKFLEGRWKGIGPDGAAFYEEYDFPDPETLRSRRYPDARFTASTDSSTVTLEDGSILARWGRFSWKASEISSDRACFDPLDAPGRFCWDRRTDSFVAVTQRWTDEKGDEQSYTVALERVPR
ncbi:MAG TPA: hypothetical protein VGF40_02005 [Thermoanaerobaculia bacterium]